MKFSHCLIGLLTLAACHATELEAPPGFTVRDIGPLGGQVLVPDGWEFHDNSNTRGNWIIAKSMAADGSYDTGLKLQLVPGVKKRTGVLPQAFVQANIAHVKKTSEVLDECPPSKVGVFQRQCLESLMYSDPKKPKQKYHVAYSFFWNDEMDLVAATIFGAPVEDWESVGAIYAVIKDIKFADLDRVHSITQSAPPVERPASPPANTSVELPKEITRVARVTTIQFVNRISELPKRLGTDLDALGQFKNAITTTMARYLQDQSSLKPAVANIMIGIAPPQRLRVWLIGWDDLLDEAEKIELTRKLERLIPPRVANGPVAFNLTVAIREIEEPKVDPAKLQLPEEWREALKTSTQPVTLPDGLPATIWATD